MAATMPFGGLPRIGVVMARLIVEGSDRGIRPFLVPFNDGQKMCVGVTCRFVLVGYVIRANIHMPSVHCPLALDANQTVTVLHISIMFSYPYPPSLEVWIRLQTLELNSSTQSGEYL